jgi:hypothetical protein
MGVIFGVQVGLLLQAVEAAAFAGSSGWMCPHTSVCALTLRGRVPNLCSRPRPQRESGITRVSAQIKFADAVEHVLIRKWDKKKVSRVVKSWRRMDEDYIHKEFKEEHDTWQVDCMHTFECMKLFLSALVHRSGKHVCLSVCLSLFPLSHTLALVQECNSYVEGLSCKTFYDPYEYDWARKLRDNAKTIQEEFTRVAIEGSDDLDKKGNNVWATAANATSAQSYGVYILGVVCTSILWCALYSIKLRI